MANSALRVRRIGGWRPCHAEEAGFSGILQGELAGRSWCPAVILRVRAMIQRKIPVSVISGFLGAGKTTLVNHLMKQRSTERVGVVVNEFGEVGIDGQLIVADQEILIEISNGCVCCTVRADLVASVKDLLARAQQGADPLDRLIIETSGLADPAPVLQTFLADPDLREQVELESVITVAMRSCGSKLPSPMSW
jgi:hypothetical protein